jgi:hypothetical protein
MLFQSMDTLLDLDFLVLSHGHLVMLGVVPARNPTTYSRSNKTILKATSCCSFLLLSLCLLSSDFIIKQQVVNSINYWTLLSEYLAFE